MLFKHHKNHSSARKYAKEMYMCLYLFKQQPNSCHRREYNIIFMSAFYRHAESTIMTQSNLFHVSNATRKRYRVFEKERERERKEEKTNHIIRTILFILLSSAGSRQLIFLPRYYRQSIVHALFMNTYQFQTIFDNNSLKCTSWCVYYICIKYRKQNEA